jgi:glycerol kinase
MTQYILAPHQETTSGRAIILIMQEQLLVLAPKEFKQYFLQAGCIEQ